MAHSKSALKRWRQSLVRRDRNRSVKSKTRTILNRAVSTIGQEGSEESVKAAISALDRAAQQGVIHKNAAARSKSRLLKRFNLATAQAVAGAAGAATEEPKAAPKKAAAPRSRAKASDKARGRSTKK
ncbi:MAG: 30S ribosomal protein S20 [Dehalococcoidia bacterium]